MRSCMCLGLYLFYFKSIALDWLRHFRHSEKSSAIESKARRSEILMFVQLCTPLSGSPSDLTNSIMM